MDQKSKVDQWIYYLKNNTIGADGNVWEIEWQQIKFANNINNPFISNGIASGNK